MEPSSKQSRTENPHVQPLNALVRQWRATLAGGRIPWFDPDDGGIDARVLILMESPAPRTVGPNGSGFCSEDNDDRSNRVVREMRSAAGLSRRHCLKWNVIPWAVLDSAGHPRTPTPAEVDTATPYLLDVLDTARNIEVVVTLGRSALAGFAAGTALFAPCRLYRIAAAPHPSQRNAHARDAALQRIGNACLTGSRGGRPGTIVRMFAHF